MYAVHKTIELYKHIQKNEAHKLWSEQIRQLLMEKKKITDYHDEEDRRLRALLKRLDDEEAERLRNL